MPRITPVDRRNPPAEVAPQLGAVHAKLGVVPNLIATLARSPVALNAYLGLSDVVGRGVLTARERELIALVVAEANACDYCLAAHTLLGKGAGLNDVEIDAARGGHAVDDRDRALLRLSNAIATQRGLIGDAELDAARAAGLPDGVVLEVLANVVVNILTNYSNHIARTEVDFPRVRPSGP